MDYKKIKITNIKALTLMQNFELDVKKNTFVSCVKQPDVWQEHQYDDVVTMSTSPEYLNLIINHNIMYQKYSFNHVFGETSSASAFFSGMKMLVDYDQYYTSAYVPKGFVSWHHDGGLAGWGLMFTYSPDRNGYFRWRDCNTGSIHTDFDTDVWTVRQGHVSADPDQYSWHCCEALSDRWTMALWFNSIDKYRRAIATLTSK